MQHFYFRNYIKTSDSYMISKKLSKNSNRLLLLRTKAPMTVYK